MAHKEPQSVRQCKCLFAGAVNQGQGSDYGRGKSGIKARANLQYRLSARACNQLLHLVFKQMHQNMARESALSLKRTSPVHGSITVVQLKRSLQVDERLPQPQVLCYCQASRLLGVMAYHTGNPASAQLQHSCHSTVMGK